MGEWTQLPCIWSVDELPTWPAETARVKQVLLKLIGCPFLSFLARGDRLFLELILSVCCLFCVGGFYSTLTGRQQGNLGNPLASCFSSNSEVPRLSDFSLTEMEVSQLLLLRKLEGYLIPFSVVHVGEDISKSCWPIDIFVRDSGIVTSSLCFLQDPGMLSRREEAMLETSIACYTVLSFTPVPSGSFLEWILSKNCMRAIRLLFAWCKVSQPQHYWNFGLDNYFLSVPSWALDDI